ncbi:MAG: tetratricopeptide repeat protein [Planctomycetaceae bacterium]|nr:tetratricopeptide repeat protein [Planctomycetaceae bacterium]
MPTIRDGIELGLEHHRAGRLQEAENIYRQIIQAAPMQPDPYHLLGLIASQLGRHDLALGMIQQAIKLNPFAAVFYNSQGATLDGLGRHQEALASFEQAVSMKGDYVEAYMNLARLYDRLGQKEKALQSCKTALRINPNMIDALGWQAHYESREGRHDEAAELYRHALRIAPDNVQLLHGMGVVRLNQKRYAEAADRLRRVVEMTPQDIAATYELGICLQQTGQLDDAEQCYRRVLTSLPNSVEVHNNLGICLALRGKLEESKAEFKTAIALQPTHPEAHSNLGNVLLTQARYHEAVACYRESLKHNNQNALAYNNLSAALAPLGHLHEAAQCGELAVKLQPEYPDAWNNLGNVYKDMGWFDQSYVATREALRQQPQFISAHSNLLMALNYDPRISQEQIAAEHWLWFERQGKDLPRPTSYRNRPDPDRPLRIGYISPDFRQHPVTDFLIPILEHHDRQQFPTFLYSNSGAPDATTERVRAACDSWNLVHGRTDAEVAQLVQEHEIDILVDLAGHTAHNRLPTFARKPAPVQVTYLGYPATTGVPTIDYLFTDAVVDRPEDEAFYIEKLWRLEGGFSCWAGPRNLPDVNELPALKNGYITFGSLHAITKLNPGVLALWAQLLRGMPTARLILARTTLRGPAQEQILGELGKHGIDASRIEIRNTWKTAVGHWENYADIDISLDVFPWCGHTTACESLWLGVPIVTLMGNRHAGRMVASVLTYAGLSDWIGATPDDYVRIATEKASQVDQLAELRRNLRPKLLASPVGDGRRITDQVESAYRQMWREWCAKQPAV